MSKLLNYSVERHDVHKYDTIGTVQYPIGFNDNFYLFQYSNNFTCLNISSRNDSVPNSGSGPRATLISPLHVICTKDNSFDVGDTFTYYDFSSYDKIIRTIASKIDIGDNIVVGELDEKIEDSNIYPSRRVFSIDGDVDRELVGKTLVVVDQDNRVGIREVSSVDSRRVHHIQGPSGIPDGYLIDDQMVEFEDGDEGCPVFYTDVDGRFILVGFLNESGTSVDFISRHLVAINNILDNYGYSLRTVNPFEPGEDTEISPDTPRIKIKKRIYWHIATSSVDGTDYNPDSDPVGEPGISTLVTYNEHLISSNYLSGSVYAIDRLCLFPQNVSIPVFSGNYDITPGYFIFQINDEKAKKAFKYNIGSSPKIIRTPVDVEDLENFCSLHYMLFGAYNSAAEHCGDAASPDSYFHHDTASLSNVVPGYSEDDLRKAIKPYRDVFESGHDAGFYFEMQNLEEINRLGCCDVIIDQDSCNYRPYPGLPDKFSRIWMVRQWVNPWFDSRRNSDSFPPLAAELVYADLDPSLSIPNWVHAGFISFEDQPPYSYDGSNIPSQFIPEEFNGNLKDSASGFNVDIQDISWDNRGRLWAICSGGFEDSGLYDSNQWVSDVDTVEGIYQLIPGGESKRTLRDGSEVPIFFPARLVKRENIRHSYTGPFDVELPHFWVGKPSKDSYFSDGGDGLNDSTIDTFSSISSIIVKGDQSDDVDDYEFSRVPLFYIDEVNDDATIRIMEWHWRPYKDKEPKHSVDKDGNQDFNDYDSTTLLTNGYGNYACFYDDDHQGTLRNSRPRSARGFMDASGIGSIESDQIFNIAPNPNTGDATLLASFSELGKRGVYTYEAPLVSEYIKFTCQPTGDSQGELWWNDYINDNYMQFNLIDSSPASKRIRLRTSWESRLWRRRETLPREYIKDGADRDVFWNATANDEVDPGDSFSLLGNLSESGYSMAMDGDIVIIGELRGSDWHDNGDGSLRRGAIVAWRVIGGEFTWAGADDGNNRQYIPEIPDSGGDYSDDCFYGYSVGFTMGVSSTWSTKGVAIVGAPGFEKFTVSPYKSKGRVFFHRLTGGDIWLQDSIAFENPQEAVEDNDFGSTVDIDGNYAVVGHSYYDSTNDNDVEYAGPKAGAVYVLHFNDNAPNGFEWTQDVLKIPTPSESGTPDEFGKKVSISGEYLAISANSGIYIYKRASDAWDSWVKDEEILLLSGDEDFLFGKHSLRIHKNSDGTANLMFDRSNPSLEVPQLEQETWTFANTQISGQNWQPNPTHTTNPNPDVFETPTQSSPGWLIGGSNYWGSDAIYFINDTTTRSVTFNTKPGYFIAISSFTNYTYSGSSTNSSTTVTVDGVVVYSDTNVGWTTTRTVDATSHSLNDEKYGTSITIEATLQYWSMHLYTLDNVIFNVSTNPYFSDNSVKTYNLGADGTWDTFGDIDFGVNSSLAVGNNNISLHGDIAVIGSHRSATTDPDSDEYKDHGKSYVFKKSHDNAWSIYGHMFLGSDTDVDDRFGYSVATNGTDIVCGVPHNYGSGNKIGLAQLFTSESDSDSLGSYVEDFAGDISRGKALYSYAGLHGKDNPFKNFYSDDPYIYLYIDDVGNIGTNNTENFAEDTLVAEFKLKVREYYSADDNDTPVQIVSSIDDGNPTSGVYKISDFNVIPFSNTVPDTLSMDYVDRGFFIVLVYYDAEPANAPFTEERVGKYFTTLTRIFHYKNRNNGDGEWDSPEKADPSLNDLTSFAITRPVYQVNVDDQYSPYRKTGCASGGVFVSSDNWDDNNENINFINANYQSLDLDGSVQISNRLIFYPKIGSYRPVNQGVTSWNLGWEQNPDLFSAIGLTGYESEWLEIVRTINMPLYIPKEAQYIVPGLEPFNEEWCKDLDGVAGLMPWTTYGEMGGSEGVKADGGADLGICTRSLSLQIICTDNIGDMSRCRFKLEWAGGDEGDGPNDPNYPSAVFAIGYNGAYRMNGSYGNTGEFGYDDSNGTQGEKNGLFARFPQKFKDPSDDNDCVDGTDRYYGEIFVSHFLPAKEKIFVDSRDDNDPFFITGGTHTDRLLLPRFNWHVYGHSNSCENPVANRSLGWGYTGNIPKSLKSESLVVDDSGEVTPYLYYQTCDQCASQPGGVDMADEGTMGILYSIYAVHHGSTLRMVYSFLRGDDDYNSFFDKDPVSASEQLEFGTVVVLETELYAPDKIMNFSNCIILGSLSSEFSDYFNYVWVENSGKYEKSLLGQNVVASNEFETIFISFTRSYKINIEDTYDLNKLLDHPPFIQSFVIGDVFTEGGYVSSSIIGKSDMSGLNSDIGLAGVRIYQLNSGDQEYYIIADIDQGEAPFYNSEVLFLLSLLTTPQVDEFTECNTFLLTYAEAGYDNAFANANAWVASPMTARNGSQSIVYDPINQLMLIRSGNSFTKLQALPCSDDDTDLAFNLNTWKHLGTSLMFSSQNTKDAYPVKQFLFNKESYDSVFDNSGQCPGDCNDIFQSISVYAAPTTVSGNNYNMSRFMIHRFSAGDNGIYQFDGVHGRRQTADDPDPIPELFGFPTIEHEIDTTKPDEADRFLKAIPTSYSQAGQSQHYILNDYAEARSLDDFATSDTRYDPPTVVMLKTTDISTGESLYLHGIVSSGDPDIDNYAPYLLIRYPLYSGSTFTQGIDNYETNRSFAFCSAENQMQVAYDRVSSSGSEPEIVVGTKLLADDGESDDNFGYSVSISSDGTTAIVGAYGDDDDEELNQGSAYIYTQQVDDTWQQIAKLTADDGESDDRFGISVSISSDGTTVLVGARGDNNDNGDSAGSAYIYRFVVDTWVETKLTASDGASSDLFGDSVSISSDGLTAIVGAYGDDDNDQNSGSAYIYRFVVDTWVETKLTASDGAEYDRFGSSVSISGDGTTAIVGAYGDDNDNGDSAGSAYIYTQQVDDTWQQIAKLTADDGESDDHFGRGVSISGDGTTAIVGALYDDDNDQNSGSAYVFRFGGSDWDAGTKLTASDGASYDYFGYSVSISSDGTTAIVGAYGDDDNDQNSGSAYIYRFVVDTWVETKITADDGKYNDRFGSSVSISGDGTTAIVGAYGDDNDNGENSGSAYVYSLSSSISIAGIYKYSIGNNQGINHGTFMQLDWHDTAGGGFLEDPPGGAANIDKMYLVQDVIRELSDLSEKDTNQFGGQICSINLDELNDFAPQIEYQNIFDYNSNVFSGRYPELGKNAITVGCHAPGSLTPDFTFPYRSPFFLMDYWKSNNSHYQPMGFFVDNMLDSDTWYRYNNYGSAGSDSDFDPDLDPYQSSSNEYKLTAEDWAVNDKFGWSVSISNDGNTAIVGAYGDDDNGSNSGSAYIYSLVNGIWQETSKLLASDGANGDSFGWSVSITSDGTTAIVGAHRDDDNGTESGSAYVFRFDGDDWDVGTKLKADDGAEGDRFGLSVSISGDGTTAVIGAHHDNDGGFQSGSAYVFRRVVDDWDEGTKLTADDGTSEDFFGISVSISSDGTTAIVGAYGDDVDEKFNQGSAYIYTQQVDDTWQQTAKLTADDGAEYDWFGRRVAVDGDTVVVGAYRDDDNGLQSGSVYVFHREGVQWIQKDKLKAIDGAIGDEFGRSVAISGDMIIVGAWRNGDGEAGSAYVYRYINGEWKEEHKLTASDGESGDHFGQSVDISRSGYDYSLIIGSDWGINSENGAAYVFDYISGSISEPYDDFSGDITRLDRCKEIVSYLFDPNYGQVYCNDNISISSLDFVNSVEAPVSFPEISDGLETFGNFKIETKDDLIAAVESIDLIQFKNINIGRFFFNLNILEPDSKFKVRVSPVIPYKSIVFMITSNDSSFEVDPTEIESVYIEKIITGLRNENILHGQGAIHIADFVPRDKTSPVRIGLTRLAEMSGGYYTPLRGDQ